MQPQTRIERAFSVSLAVMLVTSTLFLLTPTVQQAYGLSTVIIRPNGDSTFANGNDWSVSVASNRWEAVNEVSADYDTTYVYVSAYNKFQLFQLEDPTPTPSGNIDKIKVFATVKQEATTDSFRIVVRVDGNNYMSTDISTTSSYTTYSNEWTTNPNTGSPWTWSDINSLEAGVRSNFAGTVGQDQGQGQTAYGEIRLTQLYVEVTYTPSVSPPIAAVSITSPANGATLFTDFGLAVSATPSSGKIVKQGTVVPKASISPQSSLTTGVEVSYSNTGGAASGTLTLKDNSVTVGTLSLTNFQGSASTTFSVNLGLGSHTLEATLSLTNPGGSSTASSTITITVSSTIDTLSPLSFTVTQPGTPTYIGKLTYQVLDSDGNIIAEGNLGDSAASFTTLTLPTPVSSGETLSLQEPISIQVTGTGTITIIVSVTANGYTNYLASVPFTAQP